MNLDVYDNVLESHAAEFIQFQMNDLTWKYDYFSKKGAVNKHWHIFSEKTLSHWKSE